MKNFENSYNLIWLKNMSRGILIELGWKMVILKIVI